MESICSKLVDGDHNPPKGISIQTNYLMCSSTNINNDKLTNLEKVRYLTEEVFNKENERTRCKKGDILFTSVGSLGRSCIYEGDLNICFQRSVSVIATFIFNQYLKYFFDNPFFQNRVNKEATGTAQKGFYLNQLASSLIAIPPLNEQYRIVDKIKQLEPLIEKYNHAEIRLYELNSNIKQQLKKSILQYAIEGKLVPQDLNDEPATVLLERMHKEKEKLIADKKIKKDKNESMIYRRDNSYYEKLGDSEICIDKSLMFDIPISWCWVRIKDVFQLINGDRGKNYPSKSKLKNIGNIPFISAVNIQNGTISKDNLLYLSEAQYKLLGSGKLKKNDFVFCLRGSLGKNCKYPYTTGAIASSLIILRKYAFISDNYIELVLNSPLLKKYIDQTNNGTAQPNLGARDIAQYLIPLPPLNEQIEIYKQYLKITKLLEF